MGLSAALLLIFRALAGFLFQADGQTPFVWSASAAASGAYSLSRPATLPGPLSGSVVSSGSGSGVAGVGSGSGAGSNYVSLPAAEFKAPAAVSAVAAAGPPAGVAVSTSQLNSLEFGFGGSSFEGKDIIFYLGTQFGTAAWRNPGTSRRQAAVSSFSSLLSQRILV